jgi:hypothetical protein
MKTTKQKTYKFDVAVTGSGIQGQKCNSKTEALDLANYLLKQGNGVIINPL